MRKLVESTFVSLGGAIGDPQVWGQPYLDGEPIAYANELLSGADALLLGRRTYEGFAAAYPHMKPDARPHATGAFIDRMNALPKYVVSNTLRETTWNATVIRGDVADAIAKLKAQPGQSLLKYGTGPLDRLLMDRRLVDEYHIWIFPVTAASGQRLFENLDAVTHLRLSGTKVLKSGVVVLTYTLK